MPGRGIRTFVGPGTTRWYLSQLWDLPPEDVPILNADYRKRQDLDHGAVPAGYADLTFSRTAAGGLCWTVLVFDETVGIDVEALPVDRDATPLLPPSFRAAVGQLPESERPRAALEAWTCYEAWAKASGEGVALNPDDPPTGTVYTGFHPGEGFVGALASTRPIDAVELIDVAPPAR